MDTVAFISSNHKTENGLACIGLIMKNYLPSQEQFDEVENSLENIKPIIIGEIQQTRAGKQRDDFLIFFELPGETPHRSIVNYKRKFARAVLKSGMAKTVHVVGNIK